MDKAPRRPDIIKSTRAPWPRGPLSFAGKRHENSASLLRVRSEAFSTKGTLIRSVNTIESSGESRIAGCRVHVLFVHSHRGLNTKDRGYCATLPRRRKSPAHPVRRPASRPRPSQASSPDLPRPLEALSASAGSSRSIRIGPRADGASIAEVKSISEERRPRGSGLVRFREGARLLPRQGGHGNIGVGAEEERRRRGAYGEAEQGYGYGR
ncbi:hypothetical protein KM043_006295 [Ampulex compressa]|nr:hypothetical protein KM043_006295 [Ampulex compressa]